MTTSSIHVGELAPASLIIDVTPSDLLPDLSIVTAVSISVQKPNSAGKMVKVTWTGAMSAQTATTLKVTHPFVAGDLDIPGVYTAYVVMTVPSGTVDTARKRFTVQAEFQA